MPLRPAHRVVAAHQSSGHLELDATLPGGGWPSGNITEIVSSRAGCGELKLLMPRLAELSRNGRRTLLINPPHLPYLPAWQAAGIDQDKLDWQEALHESEFLHQVAQALAAPDCGAVVGWCHGPLSEQLTDALQRLVASSSVLCFLLRQGRMAGAGSSFPLRLEVEPAHGGLKVCVRRGRGAVAQGTAHIPLTRPQLHPRRQPAPRASLAMAAMALAA
ncbi:hypothetical protein [Chitinimonas lacunae]|uniref:Translesion DNA synthesis-associated protein ImuA n=1 Tax=Chitinimonas lacunae TaxID=1963018 RepID=A0ABV8MM31_9NEIS